MSLYTGKLKLKKKDYKFIFIKPIQPVGKITSETKRDINLINY